MSVLALNLAAGLLGFAVTARATRALAITAPLRRPNYRGLQVPTAVGIAPVLGVIAGVGLIAVLRLFAGSSERLALAAVQGLFAVAAGVGFGFLGLWDDIAGHAGARGWRAHVKALGRGLPTAGAIKLAGGVALALAIATVRGFSPGRTLMAGAIIALSANLFNLLDKRPGRACKWLLVAALPMLVVGNATGPVLAALVGSVAAFLPADLRERAMLGDAGANALGAIIGSAIVALASTSIQMLTLAVLLTLHAFGDNPGLSALIQRGGPIARMDRFGRVPEDDSGSAVAEPR